MDAIDLNLTETPQESPEERIRKEKIKYYTNLFQPYIDKVYDEPTVKGGAGRTYLNPSIMAKKALEYFIYTANTGELILYSGLMLHMGLKKESFQKYWAYNKQYKEDFVEVTTIMRTLIEKEYETDLRNGTGNGRFALQCWWSWIPTEKQIIEDQTIRVDIKGMDSPVTEEEKEIE